MSKIADLDFDSAPALASLHKVSEAIESVEAKVKTFAAGFAGFTVAYEALLKVAEGFEGVLSLGARMESLHLATGESVHDLIVFGHALDITGGSAESAQNFIIKLQSAIAGVNDEGKNTALSLKLLGTSSAELRSMPILDQIHKISDGLKSISDQDTKVAAIKDLFGFRFAAQALPLLSNPDALATAAAQAGPLADVMDKNAQKFHELETAIKGVGVNLEAFFGGALESIVPDAITVADAMASINFVEIGRGVGQILDLFVRLGRVFVELIPTINAVGHVLGEVAKNTALLGGIIGAVVGTLIEPGGGTILGGILGTAAGELVSGKSDEKKPGFAEAFKGLSAPSSLPKDVGISALQKVGLGGGFGGGGDPLLLEAQRHSHFLEKIAAHTAPHDFGKTGAIPQPGV